MTFIAMNDVDTIDVIENGVVVFGLVVVNEVKLMVGCG